MISKTSNKFCIIVPLICLVTFIGTAAFYGQTKNTELNTIKRELSAVTQKLETAEQAVSILLKTEQEFKNVKSELLTIGKLSPSQWVKGKVGNAVYFGRADTWADCGNSKTINLWGANDLTIEAWIKQHSYLKDVVEDIIFKGNPDSQWSSLSLRSSGENLGITLQVDDGRNSIPAHPSQNVADGTWYHVLVTLERIPNSGWERTVYVNAVKNSLENNTFLDVDYFDTSDYPLILGKCSFYGDPTTGACYNYSGYLDELRIYGRVLDEKEVLIGYWAFDEESGSKAFDSSGNENHCMFATPPKTKS
jgi:hypothetical protein